jgi:hypothetical protein
MRQPGDTVDSFLLLALALVVGAIIFRSFPRREIQNREYGYVALWFFCCAGGVGLAAIIFFRLAEWINSG